MIPDLDDPHEHTPPRARLEPHPFPGTVGARNHGCTCRCELGTPGHVASIDSECRIHGQEET